MRNRLSGPCLHSRREPGNEPVVKRASASGNHRTHGRTASSIKVACRRYERVERRLLVSTGRQNASRIPPACFPEWGCFMAMVRWFPLHRFAVSLHHRLISLLSPGARIAPIISANCAAAKRNRAKVHRDGIQTNSDGWESLCLAVYLSGTGWPSRMRLLAFHQRRLLVNRVRYTRRWWLRSDRHLNPTCLADHVRAKRLKENLTMNELACQLGISKGTLKYWELHKNPPSERNRKLLLEYLGYEPEVSR